MLILPGAQNRFVKQLAVVQMLKLGAKIWKPPYVCNLYDNHSPHESNVRFLIKLQKLAAWL